MSAYSLFVEALLRLGCLVQAGLVSAWIRGVFMHRFDAYSIGSLYESAKNAFSSHQGYLDVSRWADTISEEYKSSGHSRHVLTGAWTLETDRIRFELPARADSADSEPHVAEWTGAFKIKGDRVIGGTITGFERSWGDPYDQIVVEDLNLPLRSARYSLDLLTIPASAAIGSPLKAHGDNASLDFSDRDYADYRWIITNLDGTRRLDNTSWKETLGDYESIFDQIFGHDSFISG